MYKSRILVTGYFDRGNLGDDMFIYTLKKYVFNTTYTNSYDIDFVDIDKIDPDKLKDYNQDIQTVQYKAVFLGPGDVINEYFINKLKELHISDTIPIYALAVGFPYPSFVNCDNLSLFDYIIHRNISDKELLLEYIPEQRLLYTPDITWFIREDCDEKILTRQLLPKYHSKKSKKIGVCLTRTMLDIADPDKYESIIDVLGEFFANLISNRNDKCARNCGSVKYEIYLVPFYCHPTGSLDKYQQDDRLINEDLYNSIFKHLKESIHSLDTAYKLLNTSVHILFHQPKQEHIKTLFTFFDIVFANRFHSHVFSAITGTPFISIHTTRKVSLLIQELGVFEYGTIYQLPVNEQDYPVSMSLNKLQTCFENLLTNYLPFKNRLLRYGKETVKHLQKLKTTITNLIYYTPSKIPYESYFKGKAIECAKIIKKQYNSKFENINVEDITYTSGIIGQCLSENTLSLKETLAQYVMYTLLLERYSAYNYGLMEQILEPEYNLYESCKWILIHNYENNHPVFGCYPNSLLSNNIDIKHRNINIISSYNLNAYHRSGWGYVSRHLRDLVCAESLSLVNKNESSNGVRLDSPKSVVPSKKCILFDPYLDKTFGWDVEFLEQYGELPLKNTWSGFFHHTPTPEYGLYTIDKTFQTTSFIESLQCCKHLFVFSNRLRDWICNRLKELSIEFEENYDHIQVITIKHPTEFVKPHLKCDVYSFIRSNVRCIIQIGGWLRDTYSIYKLNVPRNYKKYALKGKAMDHYYIDGEKLQDIENTLLELGQDNGVVTCQTGCDTSNHLITNLNEIESWRINKHIKGLVQTIRDIYNDVEIIERLDNDEYDVLLSKNIVFVNLVDCSAVNTLVECIVRNTPIVINRLPAVEEYIGHKYPLFYDSIDDVYKILENDKNIINAHKYLRRLCKEDLRIENFMAQLINDLHH